MCEDIKVELERVKMTNYILEKENQILLENICCLANEKRQLIEQVNRFQNSRSYKLIRKIKRVIRRK